MKYNAPDCCVRHVSPWRRVTACILMVLFFFDAPPVMSELQSDVVAAQQSPSIQYPKPVTTPKNVKVNRSLPSVNAPKAVLSYSAQPTDQEIFTHSPFEEPLIPMGGKTNPAENIALAKALLTYSSRTGRDDFSALEGFLAAYPQSAWRVSLLTNLGWVYRQTGWYSKSMAAWEQAWALGKGEGDPKTKPVVDRALAELIVLNARLGRIERLKPLFKEIQGRPMSGSSLEKIEGAKLGYFRMVHHPEDGYRCGPLAIEALRQHSDKVIPYSRAVKSEPSTSKGTSLSQIDHLAQKIGLDMRMAKRMPGSPILAPSIVNWKVGHFAAIISQQNGLIRLHDPTFGNDVWVSSQALDAESSGYFLIKNQALPPGWTPVSEKEGNTIWGKGPTNTSDPNNNGSPNSTSGGDGSDSDDSDNFGCGNGMARYTVYPSVTSLSVYDTPLFYQPAVGPSVDFTITYSQREVNQPSTFTYSNLGPLWTFNWLSYLIDDPSNPGADVNHYQSGGGMLTYTGYVSSTQTYTPQRRTGAVLKLTGSSSYELDSPDGSKQIFNVATAQYPRKIFLTKNIDPAGNALTFTYDANYRMVAATDAMGQVTTITYGSTISSSPAFYQIAVVTDPFGRTATLTYTQDGYLASSTDMLGLVSSYGYSYAPETLVKLTTPYGSTNFDVGEGIDDSANYGGYRYIQATDPQGGQERWETYNDSSPTPGSVSIVPAGVDNTFLSYRNTFYWNKKAMLVCAGTLDYTKATITHWLHENDDETMSGEIESIKRPLESRIYYNYAGQPLPAIVGTTGQVIRTTRILDDGSTQETDASYNSLLNVTQKTDGIGRVTNYNYDTNNIDITGITQKNGLVNDVLVSRTYNSQHEPLTVTDASGQTTTYTYFSNGQINTVTNAKNETTTFAYNASHQLVSVTGPVSGASISFTYDSFGRVRTTTDLNGYIKTYDYDALNRVTQVTFPDGSFEEYVYTNLHITLARDRQGRWSRYLYNPLEQMVGTVDPQGRATTYERCLCGALAALVDPLGQRTTWSQDLEGRTTTKTFPDGQAITYGYETNTSRMKTVTDALSHVLTYSYNADDTLSGVVYTDSAVVTPSVNFTYDSVYPRLTGMTDGTGSTSYLYNSVYVNGSAITGGGRLATETGPLGSTAAISYTYDAIGRVTGTAINGVSSGVTYDSLGRIAGASNPLGSFIYGYSGTTPRLTSVSYPNGQSTSYTYQTGSTQDYRLTEIDNLNSASAVISKFDYSYTAVGDIATMQVQIDSAMPTLWTYGYDQADQLTSAVRTNNSTSAVISRYVYGYDLAGNRKSEQIGLATTQASFNDNNQTAGASAGGPVQFTGTLSKPAQVTVGGNAATSGYSTNFLGIANVSTGTNTIAIVAQDVDGNSATNNYQVVVPLSGSTTPAYDNNGNLTDNGDGQTYTWDALNELVKITYTGGATSNFSYDGLSRRTGIIEKNSVGTITSTKQLVFMGDAIAEERDASDTVTKRYYAQGMQAPIANSPLDKLYYTRDHLGSVREITDSSGTLQARYDYDPYGRTTLVSGTNLSDFQYAGMYMHQPSGECLTKWRIYDASTARWLSRDPIAERGGTNLYGYVGNNSVNQTDAAGEIGSGFSTGMRAAAFAAYMVYNMMNGGVDENGDPDDFKPPEAERQTQEQERRENEESCKTEPAQSQNPPPKSPPSPPPPELPPGPPEEPQPTRTPAPAPAPAQEPAGPTSMATVIEEEIIQAAEEAAGEGE